MFDADAARLVAAIYQDDSQWDRLWKGDASSGGIYAGLKKIGSTSVLCFRGSVTPNDWFRDFLILPCMPLDHPQLGLVHAGFYEGMDGFFAEVAPLLGDNPVILGHSLGAARAWLFAGLLLAQGKSVERIVVFGSPRPACAQLKRMLADTAAASYKNAFDPVCDVPLWEPAFPCLDMVPPIDIRVPPAAGDHSLTALHHIGEYLQAFGITL